MKPKNDSEIVLFVVAVLAVICFFASLPILVDGLHFLETVLTK